MIEINKPARPITVLFVDDESLILDMLRTRFEFSGFQVETAIDGFEALKVLAAQKIDVVVSDIRMPTMDGFELLRHIKSANALTPVILITGFANISIDTFADGFRADAIINKPFDLNNLLDQVKRLAGQ